jgi:hypothetical protein
VAFIFIIFCLYNFGRKERRKKRKEKKKESNKAKNTICSVMV